MPNALEKIRKEISFLEKEILSVSQQHLSASSQLKKLKQLLLLQKKEIVLSENKIQEFSKNLSTLYIQKQQFQGKTKQQKNLLRKKLKELNQLTPQSYGDFSGLLNLDLLTQRSRFLSLKLKKDLDLIQLLKQNIKEVSSLELKIIEEKSKLDFYVQELKSQYEQLGSNEKIQKEILKTNRTNRLETLKKVQFLKESEKELSAMLLEFQKKQKVFVLGKNFLEWKGKLPFPVEGKIVNYYGRSYNAKTNLFTFNKGISIDVHSSSAVRAILDGRVAYVGPLKNYGVIVVVEHAGDCFSLYGKLHSVTVENGMALKQNQVLGLTSREPMYFEIRHKEVAVNPLQWLSSDFINNTAQWVQNEEKNETL